MTVVLEGVPVWFPLDCFNVPNSFDVGRNVHLLACLHLITFGTIFCAE